MINDKNSAWTEMACRKQWSAYNIQTMTYS